MIRISYNIGCRNCLQRTAFRYFTTIIDGDNYEYKTEYEAMQRIEELLYKQGYTCEICGSSNVEIMDVNAGNHRLYDYDNLQKKCMLNGDYMIIFNIDKKGSDINLTIGGNHQYRADILKGAIQHVIDLINYRPSNNFTPQVKGNFFICLTKGCDVIEEKAAYRIERFRSTGLTKDEIQNSFRPIAEKIGITISPSQIKTNRGINLLEGKKFKGALFNSFFYAISLEHAEENGYSYANACFDLDDRTLIAYGTDPESPREFKDNNKYNDFVVDTSKEPFTINGNPMVIGKTIYYAIKCGEGKD